MRCPHGHDCPHCGGTGMQPLYEQDGTPMAYVVCEVCENG